MDHPRIYHVAWQQCTDLEPRPGWYVGRLTEDGKPKGPFQTRGEAEAWRKDAVEGLTLDRRCA